MKTVSTNKPHQTRSIRGVFCSLVENGGALLAAFSLIASPCLVQAQSDNFDSYSSTAQLQAAGWILSSLNPALVTTTFPPVGTGKGLRIQANPVPGAAPAVGMWYRTNDYTDFYVAVDIANWPGTDKNQAMVLFGRMTESSTGNVDPNQNPATAQGMICNYDPAQHGENPGDRRNGELQINTVGAGFATFTIAVAEITFVPGRSYRIIFKGVGQHYTAQAYDWNDLTTPLVTIENDDLSTTATHGACGILSFSRQDNTGTADATYDNYYAGVSDPNPAPSPAIANPIPGTPAVVTRVPAQRWQTFLNPATPISFTANTWNTNLINASATRLTLNGVDVSSQLTLSANGTNLSGSLPASALTSNQLYSAQIIVTDVAGTKSSTNTFWFDTFSDAYLLSASVKTIEAEEYNYSSGTFQLDPIPVSGVDTNTTIVNGFGVGYYDLVGTPGIDFYTPDTTPDSTFNAFRTQDPVRTFNGGLLGIQDGNYPPPGNEPGSDFIRSQHSASNLLEYVVGYTHTGEWLNYTRKFTPAFYTAYLRYSSFGATSNELHLVAGDITTTNQTTLKLGSFNIPNNIRQVNYLYVPLLDDTGAQPLLNLLNTNTLRLVMTGTTGNDDRKAMQNYLMFVQAPVTVLSSGTVNGTYTQEASATVNYATRQITVPVSGASRFYRISSNVPIAIKQVSVSAGTVTLTL